jgi:hypothetical protein
VETSYVERRGNQERREESRLEEERKGAGGRGAKWFEKKGHRGNQ